MTNITGTTEQDVIQTVGKQHGERRTLRARVCATIQVCRPRVCWCTRTKCPLARRSLDLTTTPQDITATRTELAL